MNMEPFIADLHIHSKFSRATAKDLDFEHLYVWAQKKGITVVGTGDFTHPQWYAQIIEKLEPAEPGLYRLKPGIERLWDDAVPRSCRAPVRFLLSCEISNIYKKKDRTRKNHNLVFFPDLECVTRFNARLDTIGNIHSDGRPILGLDARDLLEIVLETSTDGFLIPAHIWTPWFSMLGSKSGFDSLSDCFDDLSSYIFAAETGLSSDPAMNWRVSALDNVTLVSNSDAHSPSKLGREANLFKTRLDYYAIRTAIEKGEPKQFLGTFEFYPEEGKYHVDGHRKCDVCFTPAQTRSHSGICPVCGKPLTLGVLHRVEELATRQKGVRPGRALPFYRLIPLENLLSDILLVGAQSRKVQHTYESLLDQLGSEFSILHDLAQDEIESAGVPLLAEAICRMRDNRVSFSPGYDGCFGTVHLFTEQERDRLLGQKTLFDAFDKKAASTNTVSPPLAAGHSKRPVTVTMDALPQPCEPTIVLNDDQQQAVCHSPGHMMIVAGPGTGKTRTLTHKIAHIIEDGTAINRLLAVTFTNKAAMEMKARLESILGPNRPLPFVGTFHGLGFRILSASTPDGSLSVVDEEVRRLMIKDILAFNDLSRSIRVDDLMRWVVGAKQNLWSCTEVQGGICPPDQVDDFINCYQDYENLLTIQNIVDFEDLIFKSVRLLEENAGACPLCPEGFTHIFIDEYQDINAGQYRLVRLLAGEHAGVCIIGDPDQSIYGFRGSESSCFKWFLRDFPDSQTIFLRKNYRSVQTILDVSAQVIRSNPESLETGHRRAVYSDLSGDQSIRIMQSKSERAEAVAIGKTIEQMVGGSGFFAIDSGAVDQYAKGPSLSFADFAVLVRTRGQIHPIVDTLEKAGIPCQVVDRKTVLDHQGIKKLIALVKLIHGGGGFDDLQTAVPLLTPSVSAKTMQRLKWWAYEKRLSLGETLVHVRRLPIPRITLAQQQQLFDFVRGLSDMQKALEGLSVPQIIDTLVAKTGLDQTFANDRGFENGYRQLRQISNRNSTDPQGFLATIALCKDTDTYHHQVEKVSLMTMHAAKGLEFPVVFIAGCEDQYIPYHAPKRPADIEEERRLFYVALTRAKRHLFLTTADVRRINGQKQKRALSPFVKEIENRYKQFSQPEGKRKAKPAQEQLSLF